MRFEKLDLNLLAALDVLIELRNVSAAARQLNLSQSAVSGVLRRLREYFGDELLVPMGREMVLTQRACELATPVHDALALIRATITRVGGFDPSTSQRQFTLIASDYIHLVIINRLVRNLAIHAPNVTLHTMSPSRHSIDLFERGEVDALISVGNHLQERHPRRHLFSDPGVGICCRDHHEIGTRISHDDFLRYGHVATSLSPENVLGYFDAMLSERRLARRIEVRVPGFSLVPEMLIATTRIAVVHRRLALEFARTRPIRLFELPFDLPAADETLQWHSMRNQDAGLNWLLERLESISHPFQQSHDEALNHADEIATVSWTQAT